MIVKSEQKYLREILTAVRPILEQLESELIIGDTGSNDDTVEIAKEFTDKVIQIEWGNDFAHARNQVLEQTNGKWLMSLDGEEILQDCGEIIEFFNSGEYKNYASADIQMRNIVPRELIVNDIVRDFSRIGNFEQALKWKKELPNYDESKKTDIFLFYAELVSEATPDKSGVLAKIYEFAADQFKEGSVDYDMAIGILESFIKTPIIKVEVANYIVDGNIAPETDYFRLQQLRTYYMDGIPETPPMLDYFLKSDKKYNQIFGDVIFAAMDYKQDFTKFMNNLVINDNKKFVSSFVLANDDVASVCIEYLTHHPLESASKFALLGLTEILFVLMTVEQLQGQGVNNADSNYFILLELFATIHHRYLKLNYGEKNYRETRASKLPERERLTFFLGNAYEAKSKGDTTKYINYLRKAQHVVPEMEATVKQLLFFSKQEVEAETPTKSASEQLEEEIKKLKSAIYALIYTGNHKKASEVLDSYEQINPTDPDILVIRDMLES